MDLGLICYQSDAFDLVAHGLKENKVEICKEELEQALTSLNLPTNSKALAEFHKTDLDTIQSAAQSLALDDDLNDIREISILYSHFKYDVIGKDIWFASPAIYIEGDNLKIIKKLNPRLRECLDMPYNLELIELMSDYDLNYDYYYIPETLTGILIEGLNSVDNQYFSLSKFSGKSCFFVLKCWK